MNRKLARQSTLLRFRLAALAFADSIEEHAAAVRDALAAARDLEPCLPGSTARTMAAVGRWAESGKTLESIL